MVLLTAFAFGAALAAPALALVDFEAVALAEEALLLFAAPAFAFVDLAGLAAGFTVFVVLLAVVFAVLAAPFAVDFVAIFRGSLIQSWVPLHGQSGCMPGHPKEGSNTLLTPTFDGIEPGSLERQ